jgi:hypothetical protein
MSNQYPPPPPPPPGDDQWGQGSGWGQQPPPPGQQPPPPGYGYPQGYGQQPPKKSVMAISSLVLGILGFVCCGCGLFSIAAIVLGILGKKEIAESNGTKTGAGMAQAGFILGIVGIAISVLYWILYAVGVFDFTYTNV